MWFGSPAVPEAVKLKAREDPCSPRVPLSPLQAVTQRGSFHSALTVPYLRQLLLRGEPQTKHGVGSAVGPLPELLGCLGEGHVGCDSAVDDHLQNTVQRAETLSTELDVKGAPYEVFCW